MNLLVTCMSFLQVFCYFLLLRFECLPQHPLFEYIQAVLFVLNPKLTPKYLIFLKQSLEVDKLRVLEGRCILT